MTNDERWVVFVNELKAYIDVLPPYLGDNPTHSRALSPYRTDIVEFCKHFATSRERIEILKRLCSSGWIAYGCMRYGFQWIDGRFIVLFALFATI